MLDYIPFTKSQEEEIPIVGGSTIVKNQKYTLKFLQNKQNYEKINKVKDYQSLLNSPEQITTRSLDIQQYELYLKNSNVNNFRKGKVSYIIPIKKEQKPIQTYKVESINLSEGAEHFKKLEMALNKSKFNRVGSIGSMRSQEALSIQKMTRYQQHMEQQQQQSSQQLETQPDQKPDESTSIVKDLPGDTMTDENQYSEQQEQNNEQQEEEDQKGNENENESVVAMSLHSGNQQYSINNEISLLIHDDDDIANEDDLYEEQEKVESPGKQQKQQKQKRQKAPKSEKKQQLQQQLQKINQSMNSQKVNQSVHSQTVVNQSMQSAKISNATKSNKISRQQSQVSLSDLDKIEQIISQNTNDIDQAEEMQRQKMRQHLRDLEEKIQKTKERQEQFVYQAEDYQDMSGEYLKTRKQEQQQQQQQQQQQSQQQQQIQQPSQQQQQSTPQQSQQQSAKKQTKQEVRSSQPIRPAKQQRKPEIKNVNQQQIQEQSQIQDNPQTLEEIQQLSKRQSQNSIQIENSVILSLKELDDQHQEKQSLPIVSDPMIKIENKLKQMQQDAQKQDDKDNEITFADYLLTTTNVFDASYDKYKIYKKKLKVEDPPSHFGDEERTLFIKMKLWDAQNKGNSHRIQGVAEIVRGIQTRFTSDANISENDQDMKTQKSIDSDWD